MTPSERRRFLAGASDNYREGNQAVDNAAARFDRLRDDNASQPLAVSAWQLFQTPEWLARKMVAYALGFGQLPDDGEGCHFLEPSAGLGRIIDAAAAVAPCAQVTAVENSPTCAGVLYEKYPGLHKLIQEDFLACDLQRLGGQLFDAVIMNPPFQRGTDIKHIMHAWSFVRPGGILVALCYDGVRQNATLRPWADRWTVLPKGSFQESNTKADVALLIKRKGAT